ncbi:hypothetical protein [Tenacibaculum aiptasiae]|uniref:hypothetical protein n=1 Tax=Tenacibaculum aiptasiae TaxID=426481 RepID=UPI002331204B|nr:hypothetical protein [Tenacibaculum aiptasiae]
MEKTKKCICGAGKKRSCSKCSEVKMVMLLNNKYSHLKLSSQNGNRRSNPVWYSFMSKNRKDVNKIIDAMIRRYQNSKYSGKTNVLDFYNNNTNQLITRIYTQ